MRNLLLTALVLLAIGCGPSVPQMAPPPEGMTFTLQPRTSQPGDGTFPLFAKDGGFEAIPRSEWQPVSMRHQVWVIHDQLDGECTSNATSQCVMVVREQTGLPRVELAPECLYQHCGRWNTGSTLDCNLLKVGEFGIRDRAHCAKTWPAPRPIGWETNAARHKATEWYDLDGDFNLVATALQMGFVVNIGVNWPGGGGHSVCVTELRYKDGGWQVGGPNSWGATWNGDGFWWLTERQCTSSSRFGAFCIRVVTIPDDEVFVPDIDDDAAIRETPFSFAVAL